MPLNLTRSRAFPPSWLWPPSSVSWFIYGRNPLKAGQPDPLKKPLGPIFTGMENKWFVDELYQAIIVTPYVKDLPIPGGCDRLALLA